VHKELGTHDGGIIKVKVNKDSVLYAHPGKVYQFRYLKALKDVVIQQDLSTFAKKPTSSEVFNKIFTLNPGLDKTQFDAKNPKSFNIDFKNGTVTLKSITQRIYNDEPIQFRFHIALDGAILTEILYFVDRNNPSSKDFKKALKANNNDLILEAIEVYNDPTVKGDAY